MVQTRIQGAAQLRRVLEQLPRQMRRRALSPAVRAGAKIVRREALVNLPDSERRDVIVRSKRTTPGAVSVRVGPPRSKPQLMWLEFGTGPHTIERRGGGVLRSTLTGTVFGTSVQHPGQPPRPFLRPAFDDNRQEILDAMVVALGKSLERQAKRLAGPQGRRLLARARRR